MILNATASSQGGGVFVITLPNNDHLPFATLTNVKLELISIGESRARKKQRTLLRLLTRKLSEELKKR